MKRPWSTPQLTTRSGLPPIMKPLLAWLCMLALVVLGLGWSAQAATPGADTPMANYGAVEVGTAATAVPTSVLTSRNAVSIVNLGPNDIFCGWTSAVTTLTGFPVSANGGTLSVDVTYNATKASPKLYCITTVAQLSPAKTRYMEVR